MRMIRVFSALALASLLVVVNVGAASADDNEISQYLTNKSSDGAASKYANPGPYEMFGLGIVYNDDGTFDDCVGFVLPPREAFRTYDLDEAGVVEVLSVPTGDGGKGELKAGAGLWGKDHKSQMHARHPRDYQLPSDPDVRQDVIDCACVEIFDEGMPRDILRKFGIKCPPPAP